MIIKFNNIVPEPLKNDNLPEASFWGNQLVWETPTKSLLNAVSGKGKSTFIDFLTGVRKDYSGSILFNGKLISEFSPNQWSDFRITKIATVYQDLQLFEDLTILENIKIKNDLTNHFSNSKIESLIDKLGLSEITNKLISQLSFGQKQRVAIIRALAQPFELLLMDEPFSHLDKINENLVIGIIKEELHINKAGLIMTSLGEKPSIEFNTEIIL